MRGSWNGEPINLQVAGVRRVLYPYYHYYYINSENIYGMAIIRKHKQMC